MSVPKPIVSYLGFAPPSKVTLSWQDFLLRNWTGTSSTVVVRAECLKSQLRFDARFRTGEDYQLWIAIAQAGWAIGFIPEALTLYRKRPSSLTVDYLQIALDELLVMEQGVRVTDEATKAAIEVATTRRQVDVALGLLPLWAKANGLPVSQTQLSSDSTICCRATETEMAPIVPVRLNFLQKRYEFFPVFRF